MAAAYKISKVIGVDALTKLQRLFGAKYVYIPSSACPEHEISKAVGIEVMRALSEHFGGSNLWFGTCYAKRQRNSDISRLLQVGVSRKNIAIGFNLSARHIGRISTDEKLNAIERRRAIAAAQGFK